MSRRSGSAPRPQMAAGWAAPSRHRAAPVVRAMQLARGMPRLAREFPGVVAAACDVAQMLTGRLGLPAAVSLCSFTRTTAGTAGVGRAPGARRSRCRCGSSTSPATPPSSGMLGGDEFAAQVVRSRAGGAFDPDIAVRFADRAAGMMAIDSHASVWAETLACEPRPNLMLEGEAVDRALGAIGAFADLASPYLVGHSAGVAELAAVAGRRCGLGAAEIVALRRAALVHDLGRVAVPVRIWQHAGPLSPDDWERVRLHAYHTERVLSRSPFLAALAPIATFHHERLDGSGYHRGFRPPHSPCPRACSLPPTPTTP